MISAIALTLLFVLLAGGSLLLAVAGAVAWWRATELPPTEHLVRCPSCGHDQRRDLAQITWLSCPICHHVIINRGGKTGPGPAWARPIAIRPPKPHGAPESGKRGPR